MSETLRPTMRPVRSREDRVALPRLKRSAPTWKGRFVLRPRAGGEAQRAVVTTRYVKAGARGLRSMTASTAYALRYMDKGRDASELYQREEGVSVDKTAFAARARQDPHQWRIVLAPERGQDVDLTSVTRRVMAQMEQDTGYRLDWVAVNHYDTAHPHTHILVRGLDQEGREVGVKRDYLLHGLRYRTQDIVTQDLGPREHALSHTRDLEQTIRREVAVEWGRERA
jgi:type IV secretory pathway VirD2 relaxase